MHFMYHTFSFLQIKFIVMLRIYLLAFGALLLIVQQFLFPISNQTQFIFFLSGIITLGIPHGAADLLVATENKSEKSFSKIKFFVVYLGRLLAFALTLWFFPLIGNILFMIIAGYHFGETDLNKFKTDTFIGKLFVTSYGLLILSVILINHFEEVKPIFAVFKSGEENVTIINWIDENRKLIMSISGIFFFTTTFIYFLSNRVNNEYDEGKFLIQFALLLVLLYSMPLLLGFSFYFILWHSVLSLKNIVTYLINKNNPVKQIVKQISIYSFLAVFGIAIFGYSAFMYMNNNEAMAGYIFLGLAVLTAPHMEVMHEMYNKIRQKQTT